MDRNLLLAFALSATAVFGLGALDQTLRSVEDVRESSQLPALAIIPTITTERDSKNRMLRTGVIIGLLAALCTLLVLAFARIDFLRDLARQAVSRAFLFMRARF